MAAVEPRPSPGPGRATTSAEEAPMTDELDTAPLPDPVPKPETIAEPAPAAEVTPVAVIAPAAISAAVPAVPAPAATPAQASASVSQRNQVLGIGAQAAGIVGIFLFVALAVVVLLGRGWATSTVDDLAGGIDAKMAQAVPLLDTASAKVSEINGRVGALTDAANSLAAKLDAAPDLLGGLKDQLSNLQSRYQEFRTSYSGVRDTAMSALDRLQLIERLIPGFSVPPEAVDALTAVDARVQELDAKIMDLSNAITDGPVQKVAAVVAEKTATVRDGLTKVTAVIGEAQTRLTELRTQVASTADTINMFISIGSILLFVLFLYFALLHWMLFHVGRGLRRTPAA
jgi:phage shock protein A